MNIELVAQMFRNYQSNVLFHLEGKPHNRYLDLIHKTCLLIPIDEIATDNLKDPA
jgi:hypothetical protein